VALSRAMAYVGDVHSSASYSRSEPENIAKLHCAFGFTFCHYVKHCLHLRCIHADMIEIMSSLNHLSFGNLSFVFTCQNSVYPINV